jgi:hypothetical protein
MLTKKEKEMVIAGLDPAGVFVKAKNSSGSKGVAMPGEIEKQQALLSGTMGQVIIQDAVPAGFHNLPFKDLRTSQVGRDDFSIRFAAFVTGGRLMDMGLTASPSLIAHGSPNSIQMGAEQP